MNNQNNQSENNEIDMSKIRKNLMIKFREIPSNIPANDESELIKKTVVKKTVGQRGRSKKYQNISDEEYTTILRNQRREAAQRFYLKHPDRQISASMKYYNANKNDVLKKQSVYQKKRTLTKKIKNIENTINEYDEQINELLDISAKKRIDIDTLRVRLNTVFK